MLQEYDDGSTESYSDGGCVIFHFNVHYRCCCDMNCGLPCLLC